MRPIVFLLVSVAAFSATPALAGDGAGPATLEWIDVHAHVVGGQATRADFIGAIDAASEAMKSAGIRHMVVMAPPQSSDSAFDYTSFVSGLKARGARMSFLGGGGTLNTMLQHAPRSGPVPADLMQRFERTAADILAAGALGFGEITAHHLSLTHDHPYEAVPADHALLLRLADIAAERDVVIDLHYDPVTRDTPLPEGLASPPNPGVLVANIEALERLLQHNRKAKIVWAHAGSDMLGHWNVDLSRTLLAKHPNLYMSLRMSPGRTPANFPLTPKGTLKLQWLELLNEFPDRFVIGTDSFFVGANVRGGPASVFAERTGQNRLRTNRFLAALPDALARKIAYENARRIYRLPE